MKSEQRNIMVLKKMIRYCGEIDATNEYFGNTLEKLQTNSIYKNAVSMCILQIGELVTHLTNEFIVTNSQIPWRKIKEMRNIAAHHYGEFSVTVLWEVISEDIPVLRRYCQAKIEDTPK